MKIALIYPDDHSIWLFRQGLIKRLISMGHEVYGICTPGPYIKDLEAIGMRHIPVQVHRFISPVMDLKLLFDLFKIFRTKQFDIIHNFTIKPNNFATFAGRIAGIPKILNSVTGLGYLFRHPWERGLKTRALKVLIRVMYFFSSRLSHRTWFQNQDDIQFFLERGLISQKKTTLVRSSGIDVTTWKMTPQLEDKAKAKRLQLGISEEQIMVLMVSRALRCKGVLEFTAAAEEMSGNGGRIVFVLAGGAEEETSLGFSSVQLTELNERDIIKWLGHQKDIRTLFAACDIATLPSYYPEGVPRCLLEAMALEKPIITTDSVGCRETVIHGENGYMIPVRDSNALVESISMLANNPSLMKKMGEQGRKRVERDFDEEKVVDSLIKRLYQI